MVKKVTQREFREIWQGRRITQCHTGDYSEIGISCRGNRDISYYVFDDSCVLGYDCYFSDCTFAAYTQLNVF